MFNVNSLFEAWLREATEKPLAPWKRAALLWRLQEDEELRCYAAELAQFSHEPEAAKVLSPAEQQWMRERLRARVQAEPARASAWQGSWAGPGIALALGATVLALFLWAPSAQTPSNQSAQGASSAAAEALALPSPTSTSTMTPTPGAESVKPIAPIPTLTAIP